jgi:co-chaperonin GroES (HSP10)
MATISTISKGVTKMEKEYYVQPITNKLICEPYILNESSIKGLVIAGEAKDNKQAAAKVLEIGPGVQQVQVGDIVLYYNYLEFPFFDKKLLCIFEHDIIGQLKEKQ